MRHILVAVLILGPVGDVAAAQQSDTGGFVRAPAVAPRTPGSAKREAEKRRRRFDFIPATTLRGMFLGNRPVAGTTVLTSADEQTNYVLVRRSASSEPEVHARWDDLVIVRSGTGAIEMGDSLVGSTYRAPGERAGGKFTKSYRTVVHAGDLMRIPAAVPHAFIVSGTEPLEYLLIKQRRQDLPIRWFGQR
jgi:mannose-6-phosphate isomerase-like protein (cupin superfamily)